MLKHFVLESQVSNLSAVEYARVTNARCLALLLFLLLSYLPPSKVNAQEPNDVDVLRVSTNLVVFPIRVADKNRASVINLSLNDLTFKDQDKVTTAPYLAYGAERVALVFALDESGSLREIVTDQRETALALFSKFKEKSRIAVMRFAKTPKLITGFDQSVGEARSAFNYRAGPNQRTAIFDAAHAAVETFATLPDDPTERRIVILISDGLDTASVVKPRSVIDAARDNGISFYVVHLPLFEPRDGRLKVRSPSKGFRDLAEKTGGRYFLVGNTNKPLASSSERDLAPIFDAIEDDLKNQYLLGFYVGENAYDGRNHRVSVTLSRPGVSYSVGDRGFSRTHHFSVNMRPRKD